MELLQDAQFWYNNESSSSSDSISTQKREGLLVFDDKPFDEDHIVFSTRNLTQSIAKITKIPSTNEGASEDNPGARRNNPTIRIPPCLLFTHGLSFRGIGSTASQHQTLSLLPMTVCTKHDTTSFLPLDYVQRMGEYTRTTYNHPIFEVVHRFNDCVLEFPNPPLIGSSEEQSSELDYSRNCYQCSTPLLDWGTTYMYMDYLFCCNECRLKACVTRNWYKKVMKCAEEQIDFGEHSISEMEKNADFTILAEQM
ncbi:hypothetical protein AAHA92_07374 [Salvia divinorum]|uniref:FLZ-type domain-containing protein n=1 Tax=Salvia divinorum TaxID=28513 RepID=A0ABD1I9Q6_SALDI